MILPESGGIGFPGFIKEKRCNKQHQKELRINTNFLNTGKYQCNDEPDDNLQYRNGDARKFVKHRRGNDTGQNDENKFKDFQENSLGLTGFSACFFSYCTRKGLYFIVYGILYYNVVRKR